MSYEYAEITEVCLPPRARVYAGACVFVRLVGRGVKRPGPQSRRVAEILQLLGSGLFVYRVCFVSFFEVVEVVGFPSSPQPPLNRSQRTDGPIKEKKE